MNARSHDAVGRMADRAWHHENYVKKVYRGGDADRWALEPYMPRLGRPRVFVERRLIDYPAPTPVESPCRLWQGAIDRDGYGVLTSHDREGNSKIKKRAARWVWEAVNGPIPARLRPRLVVRHRCDNRLCIRLSHLELGTQGDNVRDAQVRGHLGRAPLLPPSAIRRLFELRDEGKTYAAIHWQLCEWEKVCDWVSVSTVKRAGRLGRAGWPDIFGSETTAVVSEPSA